MKVEFGKLGQERKDMVMALGDIAGTLPKYKGVFSQAYQVGEMEIDREGSIEFGATPLDEVKRIMTELKNKGYEPKEMPEELKEVAPAPAESEPAPAEEPTPEVPAEEPTPEEPKEEAPEPETVSEGAELTVSMPKDFFTEEAMSNLKRIVESKGNLMKAAFGATELPILEEDDKVNFPWFRTSETGDGVAYSHFITAICEMAKNQTRVTAKEKETDNQKYAFRCFLLRLGFIGAEYKAERKILLKNLSGSSAFKNGAKEEKAV